MPPESVLATPNASFNENSQINTSAKKEFSQARTWAISSSAVALLALTATLKLANENPIPIGNALLASMSGTAAIVAFNIAVGCLGEMGEARRKIQRNASVLPISAPSQNTQNSNGMEITQPLPAHLSRRSSR